MSVVFLSVSLCIVFLVVACSIIVCVCVCVCITSQTTGVFILPIQVKYRNLTSLYVPLPSPIYDIIVFKYFIYIHLEPHQTLIIFASTIKHNQETQEKKENLLCLSIFLFTMFFLPDVPKFLPLSFLFRELSSAILLGQVSW